MGSRRSSARSWRADLSLRAQWSILGQRGHDRLWLRKEDLTYSQWVIVLWQISTTRGSQLPSHPSMVNHLYGATP